MATGFEEDWQLRGARGDHSHQGGPEGEGHDWGDALRLEPATLLLPGQQRQREGQQSHSRILLFFSSYVVCLLDLWVIRMS